MNRLLYWTPRIASLLFVAFISLFALDVFGAYTGWELATALFMHLLPSLALLAAILVAWRYELFGAFAFLAFAAWYVWTVGPDRDWSWYLLIAGPAVVVGILYFLNWLIKRDRIPHGGV